MREEEKDFAALFEEPDDRFPFVPMPRPETGRWGVWDERLDGWAEGPHYNMKTARQLALVMIEAYAAGFADAKIGKSLWHGRAQAPG